MSSQYSENVPTRSGSNCLMTCLIVGAVLGLMTAIVVGVASFWFFHNFRRLASDAATATMNTMIDESEMPADTKAALKAQVQRVSDAYRAGTIDGQQIQKIVEALVDSSLLPIVILDEAKNRYLAQSDLDEQEQAEAARTMDRIRRGLYEGQISFEQLESELEPIFDHDPNSRQQKLKPPSAVSDEELRALLTNLKRLADESEIPDEPYEIDIPAEFQRKVDEVLAETANPTASER